MLPTRAQGFEPSQSLTLMHQNPWSYFLSHGTVGWIEARLKLLSPGITKIKDTTSVPKRGWYDKTTTKCHEKVRLSFILEPNWRPGGRQGSGWVQVIWMLWRRRPFIWEDDDEEEEEDLNDATQNSSGQQISNFAIWPQAKARQHQIICMWRVYIYIFIYIHTYIYICMYIYM